MLEISRITRGGLPTEDESAVSLWLLRSCAMLVYGGGAPREWASDTLESESADEEVDGNGECLEAEPL